MDGWVSFIFNNPIVAVPYILELAVYVWLSLCLYLIAKKMRLHDAQLAWIPFANFYIMCKISRKPSWWAAFFCFTAVLSIPTALAPPLIWYGVGTQGLGLLWWPAVLLIFPMLPLWFPSNMVWFYTLLIVTLTIGIFFWILFIIVWMAIARARRKPSWLGTLTIVPIANLVIPGILAFSGAPAKRQNLSLS
jgi:hypothetical protein